MADLYPEQEATQADDIAYEEGGENRPTIPDEKLDKVEAVNKKDKCCFKHYR